MVMTNFCKELYFIYNSKKSQPRPPYPSKMSKK